MARCYLVIFSLLFLNCCRHNNQRSVFTKSSRQTAINNDHLSKTTIYDTSVTLFGDTAYKLHLWAFHRELEGEEKANTVLTLKKIQDGRSVTLLNDSLYSRLPAIQFQDFNNDKTKDLLVFYDDGARANPRYHLYLVNSKSHNMIRIKGFEELTNAEFDPTNNIITSVGLSGSDYYSFYRITRKNKLINLGHAFEISEGHPWGFGDSAKYSHAIIQIKKENKMN